MTITKIEFIESRVATVNYVGKTKSIHEQRNSPTPSGQQVDPFNANYDVNVTSINVKKKRAIVRARLEGRPDYKSDNHVHVVHGWIGLSRACLVDTVCKSGPIFTGITDPGFYGEGVYATFQTEYAAKYVNQIPTGQPQDQEHVLLYCEFVLGNVYIVTDEQDCIDDDSTGIVQRQCIFKGTSLRKGFDTHFITVSKQGSNKPMVGSAFTDNDVYDEIVVKHHGAVLPLAAVYFTK